MTNIEWAEESWNPVTGCTQISPGCKNCYAKKMHKRLKGMGQEKYNHDFNTVRIHDSMKTFDKIWDLKKPSLFFVNSMSDLFHKDVPLDFIKNVFGGMIGANWHTYQVLTKRPERILEFEQTEFNGAIKFKGIDLWEDNIWMGVSVENQEVADERIPLLIKSKAKIKFLSCEPLLERIDIENYLDAIDWVIVGGESGAKSKIRSFNIDWARDLMKQCQRRNVAFFFKQTGSLLKCSNPLHECFGKSKGCHYLEDRLYQEYPREVNK